jgi:hypothetical protein
MSPEDRSAIMSLVHVPGRGQKGSPEEVLRHFGEGDGVKLGFRLLSEAAASRDATDLEMALIACSVFGITVEHLSTLASLIPADWHQSHENIVALLDKLRTSAAIDALSTAALLVPDYLEWDENRALARNAIWAIGKIPGPEADAALKQLLEADDEIVREAARKQIERRAKA